MIDSKWVKKLTIFKNKNLKKYVILSYGNDLQLKIYFLNILCENIKLLEGRPGVTFHFQAAHAIYRIKYKLLRR